MSTDSTETTNQFWPWLVHDNTESKCFAIFCASFLSFATHFCSFTSSLLGAIVSIAVVNTTKIELENDLSRLLEVKSGQTHRSLSESDPDELS